MDESLKKLWDMTNALPEVPTYDKILNEGSRQCNYRQVAARGGAIHEVVLHMEDAVTVSTCWGFKGAVSDWHVYHDTVKYFIVYFGAVTSHQRQPDGKEVSTTATTGEVIRVEPTVHHAVEMHENAAMIAVTIPAPKDRVP